jgi:hypothetical protein
MRVAGARVVRFASWLLVAELPCMVVCLVRMLPTKVLFLFESAAKDVCVD